jgi:hypothetical protein
MTADPNKVAEIIEQDKHAIRTVTLRQEYEDLVRASFDSAWAIANDDPWVAVSMYFDKGEHSAEMHRALALALQWRAALEAALGDARRTADELQAAVDEVRRHGHEVGEFGS